MDRDRILRDSTDVCLSHRRVALLLSVALVMSSTHPCPRRHVRIIGLNKMKSSTIPDDLRKALKDTVFLGNCFFNLSCRPSSHLVPFGRFTALCATTCLVCTTNELPSMASSMQG